MKKRFLVETVLAAIAVVIILLSCREPADIHSDDSHNNPQDKTFIVFDNAQGICSVTVYGDYRRREQDKIAEIPAGELSEEIEWTPSASVPFFFSYTIMLNGIDGFELDFVPAVGKDQREVRIDSGVTTRIVIPNLEETLSSPEQLLSNNSYLIIQNNSSFSFKLHRGTIDVSPDGSSLSAVVNVGERARYTINPGASSNYRLLVGADYKAFTGSVSSFEAGHVYSFVFDGNVSLVSDTEIILDNVVKPSPALVEFKNMEQFPVTIYSSLSRQIVFAEIEANGTKLAMVTPSPARAFYPTYHLLYQIDTTSIVIPYDGSPFYASIQADKINQVPVPKLESIEINSAFIVLKNESNVSLLLKEGTVNKSPMSGDSPVINSGQSAAYDVFPGPVSNYSIFSNTLTPVAFPVDLTEFRRGIIYVITYNGTDLSITDRVSTLQTIPPAVPDNVQAEVLSIDSVRIAWNEVYGATSYRIYRSAGSADASYSQVADTTTLSWIDTELTAGQIYSYKVSALSGENRESVQSTAVSAFMMSAGNVLVNAVTDNSVSLTWNAVSGASGYNVYRSVSENGAYNRINNDTVIGTAFTDTGLAAFTVYYYKIRPVSGGAEGMRSNSVSGKTLLAAPLNVRISAVTGSTINLAWDAVNGVTGYNVYRSNSENGTYSKVNAAVVTGTAFIDTGLNALTTYYYRISAVTNDSESVRSNAVSGITLVSAPGNVRISSVTDNSVSLAWNAVSGASGYNVYRSVNENGTYTKVNTNTVTGTAFTDTGLNAFTVYYYKVSPLSGGAEGIHSSPVSGTTLLTTPLNVRISSVSGSSISLAWNTVNGASGYNIYRSASENGTYSKLNSSPVTVTTFTDTGLNVLTTYYYRISAVTGNNEGVRSNAVSGTTLSLQISAVTANYISIAWNAVNGASGYNVYRSESENGPYARINTGTITDTTFTNNNISPYTTIYYYKISAVIDGVEGLQTDSVASIVWVPGNGLAEKLAWLQTNAEYFTLYSVEVDTDEYIGPQTLSYGKSGVAIILSGKAAVRTVNLSSRGRLFNVEQGVTLILNNNVTLKGMPDNNSSLVYIYRGTLIMNVGAKIINNSISSGSGGGVYVNGSISSATFIMNGGKISGNTSSGYGGGGVCVDGSNAAFTMNGGEISGNSGGSSSSGGGVYVNGGTFTMNGGEVSGNTSYGGGGIRVINGTFTMSNGAISGNTSSSSGGGVLLSGTFIMSGGEIFDNITTNYGGGVNVEGTFTMYNGKISGNSSTSYMGGGVYMGNGTFTMSGGEISGNTVSSGFGGGGVSVGGTFTMSGGEISGNTVSSGFGGGGVYVGGTFTMNGGKISGNTTASSFGGGVYVNGGTLTMNSGEIYGNTSAWDGGGVYVFSNGTFTMSGGTISGNSSTSYMGGGVYMRNGTFTMGGGVIYGNNAEVDLQNTAANGSALYKYDSPDTLAEYGRFVGTSFSFRGELGTTDTTIRIVNGNLQTE